MSQNLESGTEYFTIEFYRNLVYDNAIFDVAKLLDFAAIYGKSNPKQTQSLIATVLENEPRLVNEFKEAFEMMLNILKRIFKDALRSD